MLYMSEALHTPNVVKVDYDGIPLDRLERAQFCIERLMNRNGISKTTKGYYPFSLALNKIFAEKNSERAQSWQISKIATLIHHNRASILYHETTADNCLKPVVLDASRGLQLIDIIRFIDNLMKNRIAFSLKFADQNFIDGMENAPLGKHEIPIRHIGFISVIQKNGNYVSTGYSSTPKTNIPLLWNRRIDEAQSNDMFKGKRLDRSLPAYIARRVLNPDTGLEQIVIIAFGEHKDEKGSGRTGGTYIYRAYPSLSAGLVNTANVIANNDMDFALELSMQKLYNENWGGDKYSMVIDVSDTCKYTLPEEAQILLGQINSADQLPLYLDNTSQLSHTDCLMLADKIKEKLQLSYFGVAYNTIVHSFDQMILVATTRGEDMSTIEAGYKQWEKNTTIANEAVVDFRKDLNYVVSREINTWPDEQVRKIKKGIEESISDEIYAVMVNNLHFSGLKSILSGLSCNTEAVSQRNLAYLFVIASAINGKLLPSKQIEELLPFCSTMTETGIFRKSRHYSIHPLFLQFIEQLKLNHITNLHLRIQATLEIQDSQIDTNKPVCDSQEITDYF